MEITQNIVAGMSKEEIRLFKLFIRRSTLSEDRKDEWLFNKYRSAKEEVNEDELSDKLYGAEGKNAYYRLKNRLLEHLSKSFTVQYFNQSDFNNILYNIALSRIFQQKSDSGAALYYLKRAEKKAQTIEAYEILDFIYSEFIRLSHETLVINPEVLIAKRKENYKKVVSLKEIDDVLAVLIFRIKSSQNFTRSNTNILNLLDKTIQDFTSDKQLQRSPVFRFKIYQAVSRILLQQNDFVSLEKYLKLTLKEFEKKNWFNKNNHDTKVQMLTFIINSLYKNEKIDEMIIFIEQLKAAMSEYQQLLYEKYLFFYYNSLSIYYSVKDIEKAIETLTVAANDSIIKKSNTHLSYVYLNLSVTNFDKRDFKSALKNLVKLTVQESFEKFDTSFKLKISVFEILLRFEIAEFDTLEKRIAQLRKEYLIQLNSADYKKENLLLLIAEKLMFDAGKEEKKEIKKLAVAFRRIKSKAEGEVVNYNNWLLSKNL